ncbi:MAG: hypothetical protein V8T13_00850 [[Ruminococcus] lactaris]
MEIRKNSIENYFSSKKTTFWGLLKSTKKWKEIYNQTESIISLIITVIVMIVLCIVYKKSTFEDFMEMLKILDMFLIESSVGMLGFIISGLAIFTGTITNKLVKNVDTDQKIDSLIGILFSFYFIGMVIGISIFFYVTVYIFLTSNYLFTLKRMVGVGSICSYLYAYMIFYSISLLGTCIRLFFVSYKYSRDE